IDGLFAIGETMAGVHGANRLGGNSLAETVAYGVVAGEHVAERVDGPGTIPEEVLAETVQSHLGGLAAIADTDGSYEVETLVAELRELLWEHAGILRDEASLRAGLDALGDIGRRAADVDVGDVTSRSFEFAVDLGFMLTAAEAVLRGALKRTESRGAHYRTDYPDIDPELRCNIHLDGADIGGMLSHTESVGAPSEAVQAALDEGHELDYHQLE
ncbi:FAD-binding protein, partial [Natronomonas sp.]|uniref:FAD-binding protein n=1 Tax=Natronomonas sp. TaxID=2184060 RepID=UPI00398902E2